MRALVAFGSRYGTTARTAEAIGEELWSKGYDVEVVDLRLRPDVSADGHDLVVVGSAVFVGKWTKEARRFLMVNADALRGRRVALFVSCSDVLFPDKVDAGRKMYLEDVAASAGIRPQAMGMFGGVIDFSQYGTMTRALLAGVGTRKQLTGKGIDVSRPYDYRDWLQVRT